MAQVGRFYIYLLSNTPTGVEGGVRVHRLSWNAVMISEPLPTSSPRFAVCSAGPSAIQFIYRPISN